jgi:hypothetical protein
VTGIRRRGVLRLPLAAALFAAALFAALLTSSATAAAPGDAAAASTDAAAAATPADCPAVLRVADVRTGMRGEGWTVTRGRKPQRFAVEVLGVLADALAPGRDVVLVEVSDVAGGDVIAQGGGIWAGMSGSPVYVGGKLLGAIAFGFSAAPSPIGGVTPAEEMVELLDLPGDSTARRGKEPERIAIPPALQSRADGGSLDRLRMPLGVSGLNPQRLSQLREDAEKAGLDVLPYAGGSAAAPTATTSLTKPTPGGNFVVALSYGDLTAGATGTTTAVCGKKALAFGHPFELDGAATFGANDANSLTIVKDDTFGSFKFATVGAPFGAVDQDRLAGVRARLDVRPATTPVTASITAVDTHRSRTAHMQVTDQHVLSLLTMFFVIGSYDTTFDEIGDGTATTAWTVRGTRAGGASFEVRRSDRWASAFDIAVDPSVDVAGAVGRLVDNPFEKVRIDDVRFTSEVATLLQQLSIVDALVSLDGGPFARPTTVEAPSGAQLTVRAVLRPFQSASTRSVDISLRVPADSAGRAGTLEVAGGAIAGAGGGAGDEAGTEPESFDELVTVLRTEPRNDTLALVLRLDPADPSQQPSTTSTVTRLDQVVDGTRSFSVLVTG